MQDSCEIPRARPGFVLFCFLRFYLVISVGCLDFGIELGGSQGWSFFLFFGGGKMIKDEPGWLRATATPDRPRLRSRVWFQAPNICVWAAKGG